MRAILILIVALAIALVAGDRVAVMVAQQEIGRRIAAGYDLPQRPGVDITGFPFLTQAVDGHYHDIGIRVGDWSGQNITVHDLDVTLLDVAAPLTDLVHDRTSNLVATTATAKAVVPYDTVRSFAPSGVESIADSPEGLRVTGTFQVEGVPVPATVFVTVAPTAGGIEVTPVAVQAAAGGPTVSVAALRDMLAFVVPLDKLPLGAQLTAIAPAADGLHVTAVAHDMHLSDLP
ncbi:DUF2993 domain-containing protein [Nocardia sp. alder85J]|uniref:LmeA family phospholipid-binding protein n=1 Tax=Nocardia sp. alder85J TaxID=2862949 RepID=UPI001CD64DBE|nr:DUF2993 domain-containing protein [Nocardia sp. alder85J]MCX4094655.1 DUF2993 domain-containing protein [Nocardia sp. alder85J]